MNRKLIQIKNEGDAKGSVINRIDDNTITRQSSTTKINPFQHNIEIFPAPLTDTTAKGCTKALATGMKASVDLVDFSNKLKIMSTAKGGATVGTQVMFRKIGLMETALAYNPWIHEYRLKVYVPQFKNVTTSSSKLCHRSDWVCVKLVRSPLDRVVSSYIHTMNTEIKNSMPELEYAVRHFDDKPVDKASFFHFIAALGLRLQTHWKTKASDHFLPQTTKDSDVESIYLVPVETLEDALLALDMETGMSLNATGLTSPHYIDKKSTVLRNVQDVSHKNWPTVIVDEVTHEKISPPYDAYLLNATLNRKICQMFCHDIKLYAKACGSAWLRRSDATQMVCQAERERLIAVCGKDYDFF